LTQYTKEGKIYQTTTKILPNVHLPKCKIALKFPTGHFCIPTFSIPRPSKIYHNCDFWFENMPFGNPGFHYAVKDKKNPDLKLFQQISRDTKKNTIKVDLIWVLANDFTEETKKL
jgi:hypothetical protein